MTSKKANSVPASLGSVGPQTNLAKEQSTDSLPENGYLTSGQVKSRYGISNSTLYAWLAQSRKGLPPHLPPPVRIGLRAIRWRAEDLAAFEASLKTTGK